MLTSASNDEQNEKNPENHQEQTNHRGSRRSSDAQLSETSDYDPFLLLDHCGSDNPADYGKGFPWHPHRGIATITYVLRGDVEHDDRLGNKGIVSQATSSR